MGARTPLTNSDLTVINESNLNTGIVHKEHKLIYSAYFWHKVYVQNALNFSRDFVLRTLMTTVHPHDFIPVCYSIEGEYVTFLIKNCGPAINELCKRNLTIAHPDSDRKFPAFKIAIILRFSHASELKIEIQNNIASLLRKRYNHSEKILNLESFVSDPDLEEFCPLSQPKLMYFVLHLSKEFEIKQLWLGNNEIESLKPLEALCGEKNLKGLAVLDLKRNKIKTLEHLTLLQSFPISNIKLEGNPICEDISEKDYIKLIREYIPKIRKIDGFRVPSDSIVMLKRNFLCTNLGYNFVDQFLEHFFTLYDSDNRVSLESCYHRDALFSITTQYVSTNNALSNSKLYDYKKYSRNLLTISDLSKNDEGLIVGSSSIGRFFSCLPKCEHDPYSFTVDLNKFSGTDAVLSVSGVFKEPGSSLLESDNYFAFFRTFVLNSSGIEFKIINDMLHIMNVTDKQLNRTFKFVRVPKPTCNSIPIPKTQTEQNEIINCLVSLSSLKLEWARKCLEECDFNLKRALVLFMDLLQENKFPAEAFDFKDDFDISEVMDALKDVPMEESPIKTTNIQKNTNKSITGNPSVPKSSPPTSDKNDMKHIRDPIILAALKLPSTTPSDQARERLMQAANLILTKHTFAIKLHKLIGKEFYKFRLFSEARKFLTDIMSNIPKPMGEELYSIFTLYEIGLGDRTVAENMILITAETYPVHKTVKFIGEHVAKINPLFSKKMFEAILISNLPRDKKDAIKEGYDQLLSKLGETIRNDTNRNTINMFEDGISEAPNKNDVSNREVIMVDEFGGSQNNVTSTESQEITSESPIKGFRKKLLIRANFILPESSAPELLELIKFNQRNGNISSLVDTIMEKYKHDLFIIKTMCAKLWKLGLNNIVSECLQKSMTFFQNNHYLTALSLHYKVMEDFANGRASAATTKVIAHTKSVKKTFHLIPYFEELLTTKHEYIEQVFRACLNTHEITPFIKRMIILLFKDYCLGVSSTAADEAYNQHFQTPYCHPDHIVPSREVEILRARLKSDPQGAERSITEFYKQNAKSIVAQIEATKQFFINNHSNRAREIKNKLTGFSNGDTMRYKYAFVYYEIKYGKAARAPKFLNLLPKTFNTTCMTILYNTTIRDFVSANNLLAPIINDLMQITNPLLLEVLFQHHQEWLTYNYDMFVELRPVK